MSSTPSRRTTGIWCQQTTRRRISKMYDLARNPGTKLFQLIYTTIILRSRLSGLSTTEHHLRVKKRSGGSDAGVRHSAHLCRHPDDRGAANDSYRGGTPCRP